MRIVRDATPGLGDPDHLEQLDGTCVRRLTVQLEVQLNASVICLPMVRTGFSEVIGSWNHHRNAVAADLADLGFVELEEVVASKRTSPETMRPGGTGISLSRERALIALAATALADQAEGFAFLDVIRDSIYGLDQTFFGVEVGP